MAKGTDRIFPPARDHWGVSIAYLSCQPATAARSSHGCTLTPLNGFAWATVVCAVNCCISVTLCSVEPGADADDLCTPRPSAAKPPHVRGMPNCTGVQPLGPFPTKSPGLRGKLEAPKSGGAAQGCVSGADRALPGPDVGSMRSDDSAECGRSKPPSLLFGSTWAIETEPPAGVDAPL
jgi:hypothetical protein